MGGRCQFRDMSLSGWGCAYRITSVLFVVCTPPFSSPPQRNLSLVRGKMPNLLLCSRDHGNHLPTVTQELHNCDTAVSASAHQLLHIQACLGGLGLTPRLCEHPQNPGLFEHPVLWLGAAPPPRCALGVGSELLTTAVRPAQMSSCSICIS